VAVRGKGSSGSLGDAAAAAPAPAAAAAAAAATNAAAAAAARTAAATSVAPAAAAAAAAAAGLHPRCPMESSAIFRRSVRLHGREERGPATERAALGGRACVDVCVRPGERASPGAQRLPRAELGAGLGPARGGGGASEGAGAGRGPEGGGKVGGARTAPRSGAGVASTVTVYADAARLRGLLAAACSSAAGTGGSLRPSRPPPLGDTPSHSTPARVGAPSDPGPSS
jgi:hypothetical protein